MEMCFTATPRPTFRVVMARAQAEKYRRYAEAKRKIPLNLSPAEYEAEVKRLARRYKI